MRILLLALVSLLISSAAFAEDPVCSYADQDQILIKCNFANGKIVSGLIANSEVINALAPSNGISTIHPFISAPADQCDIATRTGVTVTSSSVPEAAGVWNISTSTQNDVQGVALFISINHRFPGSLPQFPWLDHSGVPHLFTSTDNFMLWATAYGDFYALFQLACDTAKAGGPWSPPSQPVTIP